MPRCSPPISGPTCFFFRRRLFSWWAARAKATVPRAVAKRTFRRPGVNRSWEKADCRRRGGAAGYICLGELPWVPRWPGCIRPGCFRPLGDIS